MSMQNTTDAAKQVKENAGKRVNYIDDVGVGGGILGQDSLVKV